MRLLLLDNYDSFTWNLVQYLRELGADVDVVLNDRLDWGELKSSRFDGVVISPGPGRPEDAGESLALIRAVARSHPLLGVCLGHQALAQCFGGRIVSAPSLVHGKTSTVIHDGGAMYDGLPRAFEATRYHSLVVDRHSVADSMVVTSWTDEGVVMGIRHHSLPLHGVQFHPESILTREGKPLLANFLTLVGAQIHRKIRNSALLT